MTQRPSRCLALVCLLLAGTATQAAVTTYSYTGNNLDGFSNITVPCVPLAAGCAITNITAEIVLADTLAPNLAFGAITPLSWSISDGLSTVTDSTPGFNFSFALSVGTDAGGDIDEWWFALIGAGGAPQAPGDLLQIRTRNAFGTVDDQTDYCQTASGGSCTFTGIANVTENPGVWTTTVVPLPAAGWLLLSALGLVAGLRRSV